MRLIAVVLAASLGQAPPIATGWAVATVEEEGTTEEAPAAPEPSVKDQRAKAAFEAGSDAYATGDYAEAVRLFEASYQLSGRPELLFNLGQSYASWYDVTHDVEHLRRARRLFQNYIKFLERSQGDSAEGISDANGRIADIDRRIERHEADAKPVPNDRDGKKPLYKKGWFWGTIVGVLVVGAVATTVGVVVSRKRKSSDPELGTIGQGLTPGPGVRIRF